MKKTKLNRKSKYKPSYRIPLLMIAMMSTFTLPKAHAESPIFTAEAEGGIHTHEYEACGFSKVDNHLQYSSNNDSGFVLARDHAMAECYAAGFPSCDVIYSGVTAVKSSSSSHLILDTAYLFGVIALPVPATKEENSVQCTVKVIVRGYQSDSDSLQDANAASAAQ